MSAALMSAGFAQAASTKQPAPPQIMRAAWSPDDIHRAVFDSLGFTAEQAELIRQKVCVTHSPDCPEMPAAVRSSDPILSALLKEGYDRSSTFQRLVNGISVTTTLVYVERGICAFGHLKACLVPFVAATDKGRYLRVVLTQPLDFRSRHRLIALIGHELQHALEVAERPAVVDVTGMIELCRQIGFPLKGRPGCETSEARAAGSAVLDELENRRHTCLAESAEPFEKCPGLP
jgi:hypothetical protein